MGERDGRIWMIQNENIKHSYTVKPYRKSREIIYVNEA